MPLSYKNHGSCNSFKRGKFGETISTTKYLWAECFFFRNTVPPSLCVSNMLYINSFKPVIIPIFRAKNQFEIISVQYFLIFCSKLLNEIPFLETSLYDYSLMKKILIIEKGISENFIFYLKLTARELLDLINYRNYVSSQQKVQSFGLVILENENISLLPLFSKVNHVLRIV